MQAQSASLRFSGMENIPLLDADIFFILLRANSPAIARQYQTLTAHPLAADAGGESGAIMGRGQRAWVCPGAFWGESNPERCRICVTQGRR
jgi:uncharacterized SAM-dependent methyltransferase